MMKQVEQLEKALKSQAAIQLFKTQDAYTLLIEPLQKELDSLKSAYDCKTLHEMAALKGKKEGLMFVVDLIDQIERQGILAQESMQRLENKKRMDNLEIDSRDL